MKRTYLLYSIVCFLAIAASAQAQHPTPAPANAALRYWMAFALLENPPSDKQTSELMEKVVSGEAQWDEQRLGKILDRNLAAIETMHRGAQIPKCDWGLEYELGAEAPVAHLARARVLGKLNILQAVRLETNGEYSKAAETLAAELTFARHLGQDGSLISLMAAKSLMSSTFRQLSDLAANNRLDGQSRARVESAVADIPAYGFDWRRGYLLERDAVIKSLRTDDNSPGRYRKLFGDNTASSSISEADIQKFERLMSQIADALGTRYADAKTSLPLIWKNSAESEGLGRFVPSPTRVNENREQLEQERLRLLAKIQH